MNTNKYERTWILTDGQGYTNYVNVINFLTEKEMRDFLDAAGYDSKEFKVDVKKSEDKIMNNRLICNFDIYNFDKRRPLAYKIITNKYLENYSYKFY
jgi:hypothetical protein